MRNFEDFFFENGILDSDYIYIYKIKFSASSHLRTVTVRVKKKGGNGWKCSMTWSLRSKWSVFQVPTCHRPEDDEIRSM